MVLVIAGSDSGGGAGIQADQRAISALGAHALTAVTALTAQDTRGVHAVQPTVPEVLRAQLTVLIEDFPIAAVKTGMLADTTVLDIVLDAVDRLPGLPLVVDPVMVATTGARLLAPDAITRLQQHLLPRASLITPNWPEALVLADLPADATITPRELLACLRERFRVPVLLKGGHVDADSATLTDWLDTGSGRVRCFRGVRLPIRPHGTGCSLASAIAAGLAGGQSLPGAVASGLQALRKALQHGQTLGHGGLTIPDFHWRVKVPGGAR
ncbi:MAG: bifunctional hydroxymethylpyrimidine kinase/phosphomethylpyrimidine kinase [Xanthomonadales bacterium]|jgi:hydroxymethylpyrimidine/phosphomethylpyrimidine kinase|nr:bifunctional hydroxymethylpyrimidine kinase/phosphomethylpyrimidine kinase [Xanthomonadales bacterium]